MTFTITFPDEKTQRAFIELLEDPDSEISYTIIDELSAVSGCEWSLVRSSEDEYELVRSNE